METDDLNIFIGKICRTCLTTTEPLINLFDYTHCNITSKISLSSMIFSITFIQIDSKDGLPNEICQKCIEKATIAYDFKNLCKESDNLLRKSEFIQNYTKVEEKTQFDFETEKLTLDNRLTSDICEDFISDNCNIEIKSENLNVEKHNENNINLLQVIDNSEKEKFDINYNGKVDIAQSALRTLICSICSKSFRNKIDFENHKKIHNSDVKHVCNICQKTFSRIYTLQLHLITHTENKAHLCPICGKCFHLSSGLRQHLKYHKGVKPHLCDLCNKRYYSLHLLKEHIRCAHSSNRYNNTCSVCNKKFTAKSTLKMHMKIHTGEKDYACDTCGKKFTRGAYLKAHVRQHTQEPPLKLFVCLYENCDSKYTSKASLKIHIRHKHTQERPYSCEICEKSFPSLPGLREHRRVHTGEKPEECVLCGNRFVNKQSLKKHVRLHTGEKPYSCDRCCESFLSNSRLKEHLQTKHMERQHECIICHKRFHLKRTLNGHMRIHSNEKQMHLDTSQISKEQRINSDLKQNVPEPGFEVIV